MKEILLNKLLSKSQEIMSQDKMYHDFPHAKNVYDNAKILLNNLGGDDEVVLTAALFHDIARDQEEHENRGAQMLKEILENTDEFPQEKIEETCLAVLHHEYGQETLNEKILSDADKMDAFNILGIGRGFMMASHKGYILKDAIVNYLELIQNWYEGFHFDLSRELAREDYKSTKNLLIKMIDMYDIRI